LTEGFGLNALEAMTLGVPVIASRRGSLPEVLGDAALFIDPDRPGTIAEAMWKLATDEAAARHLADAGVARAATFSWSRSAETLRQAYEEAWLRKRGRG
jgi:glycosyltransferase involved in cell wall biosynthesis